MQIEIIRKMPSWKKFAAVNDINETVNALAVSGIKQTHPDASPNQVKRMLADLMLGPELASKVLNNFIYFDDFIRNLLAFIDRKCVLGL